VPAKLQQRGVDAGAIVPTRYELANDTVVIAWPIELTQAGPWQVELPVPAGVSGPLRLVVNLEGKDGFASGSQIVWIRPPATR
jgi:hypothetical protein